MTLAPQVADDCIACGALFRPNTDLASMPRGRRVAWDRASGRTWRICTRCGHWNLLGSGAGAGLATELASRLPGRTAGGVVHDLVGSVEVVLIDDLASGQVGTRAGVKTLKLARWFLQPMTRTLIVVSLVMLVLVVPDLLVGPFRPLELLHTLARFLVAALLGKQLSGRLLHEAKWNWPVLVGLTASAIGLILLAPAHVLFPWMGPVIAGLGVLTVTGLVTAADLFWPSLNVTTTQGRALALTPYNSRGASLGFREDDGEVVIRGLGTEQDATIWGAEAERALVALVSRGGREPSLDDFEAGWLLARAHGSSVGLVRELLAIHSDANGQMLIRDLPGAWRAAFVIRWTEAQGGARERAQLLSKIRESSEVAAIAERLERDEETKPSD